MSLFLLVKSDAKYQFHESTQAYPKRSWCPDCMGTNLMMIGQSTQGCLDCMKSWPITEEEDPR